MYATSKPLRPVPHAVAAAVLCALAVLRERTGAELPADEGARAQSPEHDGTVKLPSCVPWKPNVVLWAGASWPL